MARGTSSSAPGAGQHGGDHRGRLNAGEATCGRRQSGDQPGEVVDLEPGDQRLIVGQAHIGGARQGERSRGPAIHVGAAGSWGCPWPTR